MVAGLAVFIGFVVAYSFFMPVWIISSSTSKGDGYGYIDNTSYRVKVSNEELDRFSVLKEIDSKTFVPHTESERQQLLTQVSEQEWNNIKDNLQIPRDDFILVTEKQGIYIDAVHSFIPPAINSDRR